MVYFASVLAALDLMVYVRCYIRHACLLHVAVADDDDIAVDDSVRKTGHSVADEKDDWVAQDIERGKLDQG